MGAPGTQKGSPKVPGNHKNQLRHSFFSLQNSKRIPRPVFLCFFTFWCLPGGPGPAKCSKNTVLSFKIGSTTFFKKKQNFYKKERKGRPKRTQRNTPNHKKRKKPQPKPYEKHTRKKPSTNIKKKNLS